MSKISISIMISIILVFSLSSCVSNSYQSNRVNSLSKNDVEFQIIINDEKIHGLEYSDDFINALKKELKVNFKNTLLRSGYNTAKVNEIIISPQNFSTDLIGIAFQGGFESSLVASTKILFSTYKWNKLIDFEATGRYEPGFVEGVGTFVLGFATLTASYRAQKATHTAIVLGRAIDGLSEKITDRVSTGTDFSKYFKDAGILLEDPSKIIVNLKFSDQSGLLPNYSIDATEKSYIIAQIINQGKGTAFDVNIKTDTTFNGISIPPNIYVGDLQPGEKKEVSIPISADLSLNTGTAPILINVLEKRGYDAQPVELQVPTVAINRPKMVVTSCRLNDFSGLGHGDGDYQPENNETIELTPYIRNDGPGSSLQVEVHLADITSGIEVLKGSDYLPVIEPDSTGKATLAFKIPRTFLGSEIKYTIVARDVRGIETSHTYTHAFSSSVPELQYSYQVVDSRNHEVSSLKNGKTYTVRLTPKNVGGNIAKGVNVQVKTDSSNVDIGSFFGTVGRLAPGSFGASISVPVTLSRSYTERVLDLDVAMTQDGFPTFEQRVSFAVKVTQPKLDYQVVLLNGAASNTITENSQPKVRVSVSNKGNLDAEDVSIEFLSTYDGASINEKQEIGTIKAGESQYRDFTFHVQRDTRIGKLPINVKVAQADFKKSEQIVFLNIVKQTALVQRVSGSGAMVSSSVYSGPPEIYYNSPNNNIEVFDKTVNFHGSIILFGAGNDIVDFKVSINSKPLKVLSVAEEMKLSVDLVTRRNIEKNKIIFDGEVSLAPGMNIIKLTCLDRNGHEQNKSIIVNKKAKLGDIYAVVVGVSSFANTSYDLAYAASDAQKFYDFLKSKKGGSIPDNRIKLLTNYEATRAGIIAALTNFAGNAGKEDTVQIYLATHGLLGDDGALYYFGYDTDVTNLYGTGFSNNKFEKIINKNIQAGRVVIYLDVCHAGMAGLSSELYAKRRGIGVVEVNQKINGLAAQLSKTASGVTTVSATSSTGPSLEDERWGGGVFTHCLLEGLNGKANEDDDEWVDLDELENYLTREVFILSDGKQKIKVNGTLIGETTVLSKVNN